jgi:hypothetical protein
MDKKVVQEGHLEELTFVLGQISSMEDKLGLRLEFPDALYPETAQYTLDKRISVS